MNEEEQKELLQACRALVKDFHIGDYIYDVREREGKGWKGPKVTAFNNAVMVLAKRVEGAKG